MQEELAQVFQRIVSLNETNQEELILQQERLGVLLQGIQEELQQLINNAHFDRDKQYYQQFERINAYKKRLELISKKMVQVQGKVDVIEKRFIKVQKEHLQLQKQ